MADFIWFLRSVTAEKAGRVSGQSETARPENGKTAGCARRTARRYGRMANDWQTMRRRRSTILPAIAGRFPPRQRTIGKRTYRSASNCENFIYVFIYQSACGLRPRPGRSGSRPCAAERGGFCPGRLRRRMRARRGSRPRPPGRGPANVLWIQGDSAILAARCGARVRRATACRFPFRFGVQFAARFGGRSEGRLSRCRAGAVLRFPVFGFRGRTRPENVGRIP